MACCTETVSCKGCCNIMGHERMTTDGSFFVVNLSDCRVFNSVARAAMESTPTATSQRPSKCGDDATVRATWQEFKTVISAFDQVITSKSSPKLPSSCPVSAQMNVPKAEPLGQIFSSPVPQNPCWYAGTITSTSNARLSNGIH